MTDSELQDLSRRAAGCLPDDEWAVLYSTRPGKVWMNNKWMWLHESTEFSAEIMMKILMPANKRWDIFIVDNTLIGHIPDVMLAYRVAVLKALCALKEGK